MIWRSRPLRLALVAVPLWFTLAVLVFHVGWRIKLIVGVVLGLTLAAPVQGLLLTTLLAPLGHLIAPFVGADNFRMSEAIVLAFLVGWVLRALDDREGPRVPGATAAWLFAATIVASIAGLAWQLHRYPGALPATIDQLVYAYYMTGDSIGFIDGARLLEGLALVAATVHLFRRRPTLAVTLPAVLVGSASAAAASSVLLWRGIAPAPVLERYARLGYRVSAHVADVNAAGSYFAMILCLALGMALRARGRRRALWLAMAALTGVGLWFSQSRTAFGAVGLIILVAATWYQVARWKPSARAAAIGIMFTIGLAVAVFRVHQFNDFGLEFRQQFNETSVRMIRAQPLFGVGIGQYYRTSSLFLSPQLAWNYGFENAHNNFLQVGAELGLLGLGLFIAWIGAGFARALRALGREPRDSRLLGVFGGVVAFVGTWLGGHPLLVREVAFPFWIQFGLTVALAGSTLAAAADKRALVAAHRTRPRWQRVAVPAAAACVIVAALMSAFRRPVDRPESRDVNGFYGWETTSAGERFRWSGAYASVFVPANVTRVYIPVRMPAERRFISPIEVDVRIGAVLQSRTTVGDSWNILTIVLPDIEPPARFKRIDFHMDRTWQPALYVPGVAEMRVVGLQFGEPTLFHEH